MIQLCDRRWRARAQNIYAGRTFSDEDLALADQNVRGGMVAISSHFTSIMFAYSAMYGTFMKSVDDALQRSPEEAETVQRALHAEFERIIEGYRIGGLLALDGSFLMAFDKQHWDAADALCRRAEQWVLAHEVSHHMARDMSSRRDKGIEAILAEIFSRTSLRSKLADMPSSHRCEIEADLLATLILAGRFTESGYNPALLQLSLPGAAIGLITVAHLRNEWSTDRADSHPGCAERLFILLTVLCELYGNDSALPHVARYAHVTIYRSAATLMTFAQWAYGLEKSDEFPIGGSIRYPQFEATSPAAAVVLWATLLGYAADEFENPADGTV
ncbi:hypothetical protein ACQPZK_13650 [Micromonospora sp. CA-249363]|uniref:hypothetical protein n=1 Tax=Micromonospora sp. CA-249363 TaxID=3239963 RepID=UPI003D940549